MLALILALATLAHADDKIVVTATRTAESPANLPFSIDALSGEKWNAAGGEVESTLATVPGLAFSANGAPGQPKSIYIRGAKSEHTLVLVDGIPVNDPMSPSRGFDFGQIPVSEIERIEVLKGPQSVLYGGDALGGVIQIFTKKTGSRLRAEGGSYGTFNAGLSHTGFRAGYFTTNGFSAADRYDGNVEPDGYRAWNLGGSKDFALNDSFLMRLTAQYQDARADTDKNGGAGGDSFNTSARHAQFLLREENVVMLPDEAELTVAGNYSNHDRDDNTRIATGDTFQSDLWKAEAILRKPWRASRFTLGAEYGAESGKSNQIAGGRHAFQQGALYLQDEIALHERLSAVVGGRFDFHGQTDNSFTERLGLNWWILPQTLRAKGSLGTGFKAPSLYQTYSTYGSLTLKPEKSFGGEAGFELLGNGWRTELTWFSTEFRDLVDFDRVALRYYTHARAQTNGVEWALARDLGLFRADNALTYLNAHDGTTGLRLLSRPRWSDTVTFGVEREKRYAAHLSFRYVGEREDLHPVLLTRQSLPGYYTFGLDAYHALGENLRLTARGVNLLDRRYQETSGFGVAGVSGYAGIEADL